jgi:hypothetical protein
MASGDSLVLFTPLSNDPPAAFATLDLRNAHPLLDFDATVDEEAVCAGSLPRNYGGGGITVTLVWLASTATTGNVVWDGQWERHQDEVTDLDADSFAAVQSATGAAPSTNGTPQYTAITFTDGAQIDSLAVGESFRFKVRRDANNASDTMLGDAELLRVEIRET